VAAAHGLDLKSQFAWQRNLALPRKLAQKARKRAPSGLPRLCCCVTEASQGRNGRVSAAAVIATKCRRLGGSLSSGFEP